MKSPLSLIGALSVCWSTSALSQYGYTPPVPPTPPTMPTAPNSYATYPASGSVPPAGAGMDMGYGTPGYGSPTYGSPTYGGYPPQPLAGSPPMGMAGEFNMLSYGYLEGFYQYTDFKDSSLDGASGLGVALSAQLFNPLFIKGAFNWASSGGGSGEKGGFDFNSVSLGVGAFIPITDRFHLLCDVGGAYYKLDADRNSLSFDDGAVYVHPGVRIAATRWLELEGGLTFTSADNYDSILFNVGAYCRMLSVLDLKLGADLGDESTAWKAGLRLRW